MDAYIKLRLDDPYLKFGDQEILAIEWASNGGAELNKSHSALFDPKDKFQDKGISDTIAIELWNAITPREFNVDSITELKEAADLLVRRYDERYPNGVGMEETEVTQYVTANSSSAFLGIQKPKMSKFANDSMISTLNSHIAADVVTKP
jgi:hypothetical protein